MTVFLKSMFLNVANSYLKNVYQVRYYPRWTHRQPRRILTQEEYNNVDTSNSINNNTQLSQKWFPKKVKSKIDLIDKSSTQEDTRIGNKLVKNTKKPFKGKRNVIAKSTTDMLETVLDAKGDLVYTKLRDKDPVIGQLMVMVKSHKELIKKDFVLLEGKTLIKEALLSNCNLKYLIFSRKSDVEFLNPYLPKSGAQIYKMPYREIQMWSDLTTTPGIIGIFKTPDVHQLEIKNSLPITVICDNIREPGNLGAILRTSAAVGAKSVLLTKGCVDLWDTKVLRSSCGAHFHLQIHKKMDWISIKEYLNARTGNVFIADNRIVTKTSDSDLNKDQPPDNINDLITSLPIVPYYGVQFSNLSHIVLIVGGETLGISEESYKLATDCNGVRLNIPLNNNIDSLNTGTALGIILFEMKKQMLQIVL